MDTTYIDNQLSNYNDISCIDNIYYFAVFILDCKIRNIFYFLLASNEMCSIIDFVSIKWDENRAAYTLPCYPNEKCALIHCFVNTYSR